MSCFCFSPRFLSHLWLPMVSNLFFDLLIHYRHLRSLTILAFKWKKTPNSALFSQLFSKTKGMNFFHFPLKWLLSSMKRSTHGKSWEQEFFQMPRICCVEIVGRHGPSWSCQPNFYWCMFVVLMNVVFWRMDRDKCQCICHLLKNYYIFNKVGELFWLSLTA